MSKQIDKIKYIQVKNSKLRGLSDRQALLEANYSEATASHHASEMTVLKRVKEEIEREFKASSVTIEQVLKDCALGKELSLKKNDMASFGFFVKLEGSYLAMFTDRQESKITISPEKQADLLELSKRINITN